jgi:hypothetical protein
MANDAQTGLKTDVPALDDQALALTRIEAGAPRDSGRLSPAEWRLLRMAHPNAMLVGDSDATQAALDALRFTFQLPITTWQSGHPLVHWLQRADGTAQIVSVSSLPPVPAGRVRRLPGYAVLPTERRVPGAGRRTLALRICPSTCSESRKQSDSRR